MFCFEVARLWARVCIVFVDLLMLILQMDSKDKILSSLSFIL